MKTMLRVMKKRKNSIPEEKWRIFEKIIENNEGENKFMEAIGEHFAEEQRFRLWEQYGSCRGTGYDKERKVFLLENVHLPLSERLEIYLCSIGKKFANKTLATLLDEENNTITVTFACDECYKASQKGKILAPVKLHYESCAGGRLYYLEKALGINLKIKTVDIPPNGVNAENPCVFVFDIIE